MTNGEAVANAGDVNGDGVNDIMVGSIWTNSKAGQAKVFSGANGALLHTFDGNGVDCYLGNALCGAGDVDGDGYDDMLIGAWGESFPFWFSGVAYLYSGFDGSLIRSYAGGQTDGNFGCSVANAGDIDGDGVPDQLIGELGHDSMGPDTGAAYLFSGATGSMLNSWYGANYSGRFGDHVAGISDLDGDGIPDLLISARWQGGSGVVFAKSGSTGNDLFHVRGFDPDETFCSSVGTVGDVNGDGLEDILVGSDGYYVFGGQYTGSARVFSGADGQELQRFNPPSSNGRAGLAVAGLGDLNGDGIADWAVGAPAEDFTAPDSGSVHVVSGQRQGLHFACEDAYAGGSVTLRARGATPGGIVRIGYSLTGGGPTNTSFGVVELSAPILIFASLTADAAGVAQTSAPVPPSATGLTVWTQALDLTSGSLSNPNPMKFL